MSNTEASSHFSRDRRFSIPVTDTEQFDAINDEITGILQGIRRRIVIVSFGEEEKGKAAFRITLRGNPWEVDRGVGIIRDPDGATLLESHHSAVSHREKGHTCTADCQDFLITETALSTRALASKGMGHTAIAEGWPRIPHYLLTLASDIHSGITDNALQQSDLSAIKALRGREKHTLFVNPTLQTLFDRQLGLAQ